MGRSLEDKLVDSVVEQEGLVLDADEVREALKAVQVRIRLEGTIAHLAGAVESYQALSRKAAEEGHSDAEDSYDFLVSDAFGKKKQLERILVGE